LSEDDASGDLGGSGVSGSGGNRGLRSLDRGGRGGETSRADVLDGRVGLAGREGLEVVREAETIHRNNRGTTQTNICQERKVKMLRISPYTSKNVIGASKIGGGDTVLEGNLAIGDLASTSHLSQLPAKLSALSETGSTKRVALGDQTSGRVNDPFSTVGDVATIDQLTCLTNRAELKSLIGDQLIRGEAIVQLNDLSILGCETSLGVDVLSSSVGHFKPNHLDARVLEGGGKIGPERHADDLDSLVLQVVLGNKLLAGQDGATTTLRLH
jgi:hypothetical protein